MAKINKGILGALSGKLGPVVGSSWKGNAYLRMAPEKKSKPKILSPAQLAHHQKFSFLTKWLQPLHPYLTAGFRNLAKDTTEVNAAFSYNFKNALKGAYPDFYIDYEAFRLSRGILKGVLDVNVSLAAPNTILLSWTNENGANSEYSDQLMLVLYNDEIGFADGFTGGAKRAAKTCTFIFENKLVGKPFHVFIGLIGINGHKISESQYLGRMDPL